MCNRVSPMYVIVPRLLNPPAVGKHMYSYNTSSPKEHITISIVHVNRNPLVHTHARTLSHRLLTGWGGPLAHAHPCYSCTPLARSETQQRKGQSGSSFCTAVHNKHKHTQARGPSLLNLARTPVGGRQQTGQGGWVISTSGRPSTDCIGGGAAQAATRLGVAL